MKSLKSRSSSQRRRTAKRDKRNVASPAPIITLTSDFGLRDYFVGSVKGVLLRLAPEARLVDITHDIPPQDLISGAFVIKEASRYFSDGAVHLVVVDPGVGTARRKIVLERDRQFFVAPDNGVLTYLIQREGSRVFEVRETPFLRFQESPTFAGRDHFAPIAAFLATGLAPSDFGKEIHDFCLLKDLLPEIINETIHGKIVYIDHFGNAITNLTETDLMKTARFGEIRLNLKIKGETFRNLKKNYLEGEPEGGNLIINSSGHLEIFVPGGSAKRLFNLNLLDEVLLERI